MIADAGLRNYLDQFYWDDVPSILENYPFPKPGEEKRVFRALPGTPIELESLTGINRYYIIVLLKRMRGRGLVTVSEKGGRSVNVHWERGRLNKEGKR